MAGVTYRKISCLVTNSGVVAKKGVRPAESDLGIISGGAVVFDRAKGVLWSGSEAELPGRFKKSPWKQVDCRGLTAYPGLVDPHTHPVFAGDRSREFELRMQGATYQSIAAAGGGIVSTVKHTRAASKKDLSESLLRRLKIAGSFGVRLLEAKSGYGLDLASELRSLSAISEAKSKIRDMEIVPTCMAAHAIPVEHKQEKSRYVKIVCDEILPQVAKKKLAVYTDVFCDEGYFSVAETLSIMDAAKRCGLSTRLHGEELGLTGIAKAGAEAGAHSIDHLLKVDDAGIAAMATHGTVGVLLPATAFYLREPSAPARKLIDAGVVVALATDFNPGSSPTQNFPFIGTLAAISLGMTTAEIISAMTWAGARSLRREAEYGALLPGFKGKPAFAEGDHPSALFYRVAPPSLPDPESRTR